jgi:hypothetical protein
MVVTEHVVMSTCHAKEVVLACKLSQQKMQAVADMLLLTRDMRPVHNDKVSAPGESYPKYRDTVVTKTKGLLVATGKINELVYSVTARWQDVCSCIQDICELVVSLAECCAHLAYLVGVHNPLATAAVAGVIDQYKLKRSNLDIELSCQRLKQTNREMLVPPLLVQICSTVSSNLYELTESCKSASELATEAHDQDQFKHCIKSFTASGSCLLSSIKCFKRQPTELHQQRCINFCEPLLAAVRGMVSFAVEEQFLGKPAVFPTEARDNTKGILGNE